MTAGVPNAGAERNGDGLSGVGRYAGTPEPVQGNSAAEAWASVEALAALLEPEAFDPEQLADEGWRERTQNTALGYAGLVIAAGYRRVVEDDDTIERVARILHDRLCDRADGDEACEDYDDHRWWKADARAVVRALREDT
jgi:hypothetical protein